MQTTEQTARANRLIRELADRLIAAAVDEIVPHHELINIVRRHGAPRDHYLYVGAAKYLLNRECGAVFATVRREGYRRLDSSTGVNFAGSTGMGRVRRVTKRFSNLVTHALRHANGISTADRRQANQRLATLGLIEHLTLNRTVRTMPEEELQPADPLEGLRRALGR